MQGNEMIGCYLGQMQAACEFDPVTEKSVA
jgi:hypothetical protein